MTDSPTSQAMHLAMTELEYRREQIAELRWIVNGFLEWHEGNPCPEGLIERAMAAVPPESVRCVLNKENGRPARRKTEWEEDFSASGREHADDDLCATCGKIWGAHFGRCCDSNPSERRFTPAAQENTRA